MSHINEVIHQIESQKKDLNLPIRLKERTEYFTSLLFETLFDVEASVSRNLSHLAIVFDELVELACWDKNKSCIDVWQAYLETFPVILNKLRLDAKAFLDSDPAANSIEEIYLAYPGFFAIAVYRLSLIHI